MQNTMNTYSDLSFVVPDVTASAEEIPKTFIYADNIASHLRTAVRPYNAAHSAQYRENVMDRFKNGLVRILICTDAAGMVRITFWC